MKSSITSRAAGNIKTEQPAVLAQRGSASKLLDGVLDEADRVFEAATVTNAAPEVALGQLRSLRGVRIHPVLGIEQVTRPRTPRFPSDDAAPGRLTSELFGEAIAKSIADERARANREYGKQYYQRNKVELARKALEKYHSPEGQKYYRDRQASGVRAAVKRKYRQTLKGRESRKREYQKHKSKKMRETLTQGSDETGSKQSVDISSQ